MLTDTHAHLYLKHFKEDIDPVIDNAITNGITKIYLPNIDSSTIEDMLKLENSNTELFRSMAGVHPGSVKEDYKRELEIVERELDSGHYVGVGEVGIDLYWDKTYKEQQIKAFDQQVKWALKYDLPVIIHAREAMDLTIDIVRRNQTGSLKGIFHCFTGNIDQAFEIMKLGFYMGIGGIVTYKNSGLADTVREIPLEYIVLETDAPYLPPVPYRGKRNESSYLTYIAEKVAEIKNTDIKEVAAATTHNAAQLFKR